METFTITKFDDHIRIESNLGCVRVEPNSIKDSVVAKAGGVISAGGGVTAGGVEAVDFIEAGVTKGKKV